MAWIQNLEIYLSRLSPQLKLLSLPIHSHRSSTEFLAGFPFRELNQMGGKIAGAGAVKSFCIGIGLFMFSQNLWILYGWNEERKVRKLYEGLLEKGEIYQDLLRKGLVSVVAEDE